MYLIIKQAPMSFTFGIMVYNLTPASQLRMFIRAVRALSIPTSHYEIIVAGASQQQPDEIVAAEDDALGDLVYLCATCEFSDKIRAIFEAAAHEFVWVSHDYVLPLPNFYHGMRSFGRGAPWLVPGVFLDLNGREVDESAMRGRLFSSKDYISGVSWLPDYDIAPIGSSGDLWVQSFYSPQEIAQAAAANSTAVMRRLIAEKFAIVPRNMRLSAVAAAAAFVNGNILILARTLGQLIPARSRLPWGMSEDIDWGARLAQHVAPEENAFIGAQFLKTKVLDQDAALAEQLCAWLLAEGLGTIVAPEALSHVYWCNTTWGCGHIDSSNSM